jgi:HSP20 family protein
MAALELKRELKKLAPWNWFKHEETEAGSRSGTGTGSQSLGMYTGGSDPLMEMHQQVDRLFNSMLRGFALPSLYGNSSAGLPALSASSWLRPSVDIAATDKQYTITVEVPGVEENDLALEMVDDSLIIRGEKKLEQEQKDKEFYRTERSYGSFRRVLSLPQDADWDRIDAQFNNGVLTIILPRKAQAQTAGRRIGIRKAA